MPGARTAVTALVALTVVDVFHTIVVLAAYEHRIGVVTHDGSGTVDMLDTVVPLRELSAAMSCLLFLTLLTAWAGVANWVILARRTGPPVAPTEPVAWWWMSAIVAVPLNLIAAVQYLYATANGAEYMRTVLAETTLLLVAASVALVTTTIAVIQVVRHTAANQQRTAGARATTA
ncbi:hypothetical protein GA0070609_3078 [Micromonospora echinaurantiaca]|uniref:Uncharacterized protein n=1 Tax=Micromonospora echinaurantiaca TaxID=47857 RepID=A0A1C5IBE4_9ACTN|nr:hypothetical protein [Micromonospora echinaurantiaca]SCG55738.1 hypothetical protein GA0070609_3078 [Micromonospora echinaurantiaca]